MKEKRWPKKGIQYGNIPTLRSPSPLRYLGFPARPVKIRVTQIVSASNSNTADATGLVDVLSQSLSISECVKVTLLAVKDCFRKL